jgi:hypothetical protein
LEQNIRDCIQEKGFFLYQNFADHNETGALLDLYQNAEQSDNKNYPIRTLELSKIPREIFTRINTLKEYCFSGISSEITNAVFFSIKTSDLQNSINSDFHQDHESFYFSGDHFHHLNFYLVVEKDDINHSNLDIVPMDKLSKADKKFADLALGSGATIISDQHYYLQSKNLSYKFDFDINSVIETPKLDVGDLLILRGDVIHRTQDQQVNRVALSIRSGRTDLLVEKYRYYPTSLNHLYFIKNNVKPYAKWAFLFKIANKDFMTLAELRVMYSEIGKNYTEDIASHYRKFLDDYTKFLDVYENEEKNRQQIISEIGNQ